MNHLLHTRKEALPETSILHLWPETEERKYSTGVFFEPNCTLALRETQELDLANSQTQLFQSTLLFSAFKFSFISFLIVWFLCNFKHFFFVFNFQYPIHASWQCQWSSNTYVLLCFLNSLRSWKVFFPLAYESQPVLRGFIGLFLSPSDLITASVY